MQGIRSEVEKAGKHDHLFFKSGSVVPRPLSCLTFLSALGSLKVEAAGEIDVDTNEALCVF